MPTVQLQVCEICKGLIPDGAPMIYQVSGALQIPSSLFATPVPGAPDTTIQRFDSLVFCSAEHLHLWIENLPVQLPVPDPPYATPTI